ncbi:uncharacterized protein EV154DRAFT_520401 [Mucor mucedo]|uniref:uncharacterized protein n=1 Tax=Mucor mucedo TaxID=29922 RepID=UPI00221EE6FA|nr:uncharacterized protein EV154DRAFT_520401 [Mucor mucedo]KAI7887680.1 hypothetical protein EV154DRAFT_520401 [Mucor mucedo]
MKNTVLICLIILFALSVRADEIPPCFGSNCAYTFDKIYCYGGKLDNKQFNNDMYELNLNSLSQIPVSDIVNKWTLITPNPSSGVPQDEYRYGSQFVVLPDGSLFFDGGYNEDHPLVARNITYNPQKNVWTVLPGPSYNDSKNGGVYRQVYSAAAVHLPDTNSVAFYGGRELNAALNFTYTIEKPFANLTYEISSEQDPSKKLVEGIYGYGYLTELNLDTGIWTSVNEYFSTTNYFPPITSYATATYHPGSKRIIYLGGFSKDEFLVGSTDQLDRIKFYDTRTADWGGKGTNGFITPTSRLGHTATLLNTGNNILVYGGIIQTSDETLEGKLSPDYMFDLDLNTLTWTVINRPTNSSGPRAFHSAVLVNGTSLFIMFGKKNPETAGSLVAANDIMILNVTDRNAITSLNTYPNPTNNDSASNGGQSKGLSGGAIAGIVVGVVALIAILVLAALYRKKSKDKAKRKEELRDNYKAIDGEYKEVQPFSAEFSGGSTDVENTSAQPIASGKSNQYANTYSPDLADSKLIKPDVYTDLQTKPKPDVHGTFHTKDKPDVYGGFHSKYKPDVEDD